MNKISFLALVAFIIISCGTPKATTESKETATTTQKVIDGNWTLKSISYSDEGNYLISIFNDTSKECFEGSSWNFSPNDNSGDYTISNTDCKNGKRTFRFIAREADASTGLYDFQLKLTGDKYQSDKSPGFTMSLSKLTGSSMKWEQTVLLEGNPVTIEMSFSK